MTNASSAFRLAASLIWRTRTRFWSVCLRTWLKKPNRLPAKFCRDRFYVIRLPPALHRPIARRRLSDAWRYRVGESRICGPGNRQRGGLKMDWCLAGLQAFANGGRVSSEHSCCRKGRGAQPDGRLNGKAAITPKAMSRFTGYRSPLKIRKARSAREQTATANAGP